jgi:photosystem II stability/assembly factor-like uncharacterized protein
MFSLLASKGAKVAIVIVAVVVAGGLALKLTNGSTARPPSSTQEANAVQSLPQPLTRRSPFAPTQTTASIPTTTTTTAPTQATDSSLDAVSCADASDCVAVGDDGSGDPLIESTDDGGSTFSTDQTPSGNSPPVAVSCSGASTCVAVGAGSILSSSDGGQTWSTATDPVSGSDLLGVDCSSSNDCVAVGMLPEPAISDLAVILDSDDGGQTWTEAQFPSWAPAMGSVFCTSDDCIAVGASVLVSSDGGQTWTNEAVTGGIQALSSVACSSAQSCFAIGPNGAGISHPDAPSTGASTDDGGQTWTSMQLPDGTPTAWAASCFGLFCMVVGPQESPHANPLAEVSSDGGEDWSAASALTDTTSLRGVDCVANSQCIAVGQGPNGAMAASYSTDTWNESEVGS